MPFSERVYDPETLALMTRVLDETRQAVLSKSVYRALDQREHAVRWRC